MTPIPAAAPATNWTPSSVLAYLTTIDGEIATATSQARTTDDFITLKRDASDQLEKLNHYPRTGDAAVADIEALWNILAVALQHRLETIAGSVDGFVENTRSLMNNAQAWAIHFSNIRLGLTTFLVSISWGIVATQWSDYDPALKLSALAVWSLAILLFGVFTANTFRKERKERENLQYLRLGRKGHGEAMSWGWVSFSSLALALVAAWVLASSTEAAPDRLGGIRVWGLTAASLALWMVPVVLGPGRKLLNRLGRLSPDLALIVATVAFGILLSTWSGNKKVDTYHLSMSESGHAVLVTKDDVASGQAATDGAGSGGATSQAPDEVARITSEVRKVGEMLDGLTRQQEVFAKIAASVRQLRTLADELPPQPTSQQLTDLRAELENLERTLGEHAAGRL